MNDFLSVIVSGISGGVPVFLVASGLTLIYGVLHVLNFAHGAFFLIGAYVVTSVWHSNSFLGFVGATLLAGLVVTGLGVASELVIFRRIYKLGSVFSLLGSFALFLALAGIAQQIWGVKSRTVPFPQGLDSTSSFLGIQLSQFDLALALVGIAVAVGLYLLLAKTTMGKSVRAVSTDRTMAMALGIRTHRVSTIVFAIGSFLAGFGGALIAPSVSIGHELALSPSYILPAFIVLIVGGLGSVLGAFIAALTLGVIESVLFHYFPGSTGISYYLVVAIFLIFRPQGIFGSTTKTTEMAR